MSEIPNLVEPESGFEGARNSLATKQCKFLEGYKRFLLRSYEDDHVFEPKGNLMLLFTT